MVCAPGVRPACEPRDVLRVRVLGLAGQQGASALSRGRVRTGVRRVSTGPVGSPAGSWLRLGRSPVRAGRVAAPAMARSLAAPAKWLAAGALARSFAAPAKWLAARAGQLAATIAR